MTCNTSLFQNDTNTSMVECGPILYNTSQDTRYTVLSEDEARTITFALECILFPIITVIGISGNILSLYVLAKKNTTTSILLIGLAVADTLYLASNMLLKSTCIIKQFDPYLSRRFYVYSFSVLFYIKTAVSRVSTWLVVVISAERLYAVVSPFKVKYVVTKTKVMVTVVVVYGITFASLILIAFQFDIKSARGIPFLGVNDLYTSNKEFFHIYNQYATPILFRWVPKTVLIILNISICLVLRNNKLEKVSNIPFKDSRQQRDQKRVTKMLLIVAIVFVICLLPGDAFLIATTVKQELKIYGQYHNLFVTLSDVVILFEMVNSSINFIIYTVVNSAYSVLYKRLFCPRRWRRQMSELSMQNSAAFSFRHSDLSLSTYVSSTTDVSKSTDVSKTNQVSVISNRSVKTGIYSQTHLDPFTTDMTP